MTRIGFIGLGITGGPMAANLVRSGFEVMGCNRSRAKVDRLVEQGGRAAASVAEAVGGADVVVTVLPDSPDLQAVALGDDGIFANSRAGVIYIDMSTIRPATARMVGEAGRAVGVRVLDAPVSGGEKGAIEGTLSVMVGGEAPDVEKAWPVLDVMGRTIGMSARRVPARR